MKRTTRLALSMCTAVGALTVVGSALAVPRVMVGSPDRFALGGSTVSIRFTEENTDAAPAKLTFYAPAGYTANGAAVGQQIGTVHAVFQTLATSSQSKASVNGTITVQDPAKSVSNTCSTGSHTAVWQLHMTVAGQALNIPVFVDTPVPASDAFAGNSQVRLVACLASPYAQAGAARAPVGAKLTNLALTLNQNIVVNPSTRGVYTWRTLVTPYTVNSGSVNNAGTVEARAPVFMPKRVTLTAKVVTKRQHVRIHGRRTVRLTSWARLQGRVTEGLDRLAGVKVALLTGPTSPRLVRRGFAITNDGGLFSRQFRLMSKATFQARVTLLNRDVTSRFCTTSTPGIPCVSATAPAFSILSDVVTLKPRRR
ncbi:MAG: hypothetical protein ACJ744_00270 [Gaiellaceae bacterium]|jgi:hypothetical protein